MAPRPMTRALIVVHVAGVLALGGCGDSTTTPQRTGPPELTVTAGGEGRDTAGAWLPGTLRVEVRDPGGAPLPDEPVRFDAVLHAPGESSVLLATTTSGPTFPSLSVRSNQSGVVELSVKLGPRAGTGTLRVSAPRSGYTRTLTYQVDPGQPVSIAPPTEGWIVRGQYRHPEVLVLDRNDNVRDDAVSLESDGPVIEVSDSLLWGRQFGRADVRAHSGGLSASFSMTVGPAGRIAAVARSGSFSGGPLGDPSIYITTLGQTGIQELGTSQGTEWPHWSPTDSLLVFTSGYSAVRELTLASPSGPIELVDHGDTGLRSVADPQFSADGEWIYFTGEPDGQRSELWRVPTGGGTAQRLSDPADNLERDVQPSPSPDGENLAFLTNRRAGFAEIAVMELESGLVTELLVPASSARWSPTGEWIAYVAPDGELRLVRPDGSGDRSAAPDDPARATSFTWSPDGDWILAYLPETRRSHFVQIATGLTLTHPWLTDFRSPSWGR